MRPTLDKSPSTQASRRSEKGSVAGILVLIVVVGTLVLLGTSLAGRASNNAPRCDGEFMGPGDTCTVLRGPGSGGTYEEMKKGVAGNQRGDRIAAAVCFGLAGLALIAGFFISRSRKRDARARRDALGERSLTEVITSLAAQDRLGALLDITHDDSWIRKGRGKRAHHRFERGLVADTERGPMSFPYRDLRIKREHTPGLSTSGNPVTSWRFQRGDRPAWETLQPNNSPLGRMLEQVFVDAERHRAR